MGAPIKCYDENLQCSALQWEVCRRWFWNRGGLAVHRCRRKGDLEEGASGAAIDSQGCVECRECGRTLSRQKDVKRHKCLHEGSEPV